MMYNATRSYTYLLEVSTWHLFVEGISTLIYLVPDPGCSTLSFSGVHIMNSISCVYIIYDVLTI